MNRRFLALSFILPLAACFQAEPPKETPAFAGTWTCEDRTLQLTAETFDDGKVAVPIRLINREDRNYELLLQNGQRIGLVAVTGTGLTLVTSTSGRQFVCARAN